MINSRILTCMFLLFLCISCKKKKEPKKALFTWDYKGNAQICETPYAEIQNGMYHQIHAEKSTSNALHLYPHEFGVGSYVVDSNDTINTALLVYEKSFDTILFMLPTSGTINITQAKDNYLNGNFNLVCDPGDTIKGQFENVPIQ